LRPRSVFAELENLVAIPGALASDEHMSMKLSGLREMSGIEGAGGARERPPRIVASQGLNGSVDACAAGHVVAAWKGTAKKPIRNVTAGDGAHEKAPRS